MKKVFLLFHFLMVMTNVFAQSTWDKNSSIQTIKKEYSKINAIKKWTQIKEVYLEDSVEGGEAKFYYHGKNLQKITAIYMGETGKRVVEFYLKQQNPFFIFEKITSYQKPIYIKTTDKVNRDKIKERRTYLAGEQVVLQLEDRKVISQSNTNEKELLMEFQKLKNLLH